jgi:hypothetical protein
MPECETWWTSTQKYENKNALVPLRKLQTRFISVRFEMNTLSDSSVLIFFYQEAIFSSSLSEHSGRNFPFKIELRLQGNFIVFLSHALFFLDQALWSNARGTEEARTSISWTTTSRQHPYMDKIQLDWLIHEKTRYFELEISEFCFQRYSNGGLCLNYAA